MPLAHHRPWKVGQSTKLGDFPPFSFTQTFVTTPPSGAEHLLECRGSGKPAAWALALVLNAKPAAQPFQRPRINFGRFDGARLVLDSPSQAAGWELGKAYALGPSAGHLAPLFLCSDLGNFCPTFICNRSRFPPSHLGRHGDLSSSSLFFLLQAKWAKLS